MSTKIEVSMLLMVVATMAAFEILMMNKFSFVKMSVRIEKDGDEQSGGNKYNELVIADFVGIVDCLT